MELDRLQIELRPRPNAQALDLGFALLRAHARDVYLAWLALWLPLVALSYGLAYLFPNISAGWMLLPWWLKPLLERAPLYILSRQVFGQSVGWRQALRAWPRQLGGGWFRMLTWWRPFVISRGLYQPIWQLEGARGKVAAERCRVIGDNTGGSAYWFGVVCAHFEAVLQIGMMTFIGIFLSDDSVVNPFAYLVGAAGEGAFVLTVLAFAIYGICGGIIGPVYTSCCFTLYLNRRATLEAWDIEIMLRQIRPPASENNRSDRKPATALLALLIPAVLALALVPPDTASAADSATSPKTTTADKCAKPEWVTNQESTRSPDQTQEQKRLREEVDHLYQHEDLRFYKCEETWQLKRKAEPEEKKKRTQRLDLALLATILKIVLIAAAITGVGWLLYRYRDKFSWPGRTRGPVAAIEVGGLDIRAESLPADVAESVRKLWQQGARRSALGLLYRATLSRLVTQDGLLLTQGATEGDCLRAATQANRQQRLAAGRLTVVKTATDFWLNGAYGDRWPDTADVMCCCTAWQAQFDGSIGARA